MGFAFNKTVRRLITASQATEK